MTVISPPTGRDTQLGASQRDGQPAREPLAAIQLINAPTMRLGALTLDPPHRRLVHDDGREAFLEPRVMQVLVAFARAPGAILSRDDLIAACWDGRFVSDDAVNRVMSRLRRVFQEIGDGRLRLETLTKVGFRLIVVEEQGCAELLSDGPEPPRLDEVLTFPPTLAGPTALTTVEESAAPPAPAGAELTPVIGKTVRFRRLGALVAAVVAVGLVAIFASSLILRSKPGAKAIPELQLAGFDNLSPALVPGAAQAVREELAAAFGRSAKLQVFTDSSKPASGPLSFRLGGAVQQLGPALRFAVTLSRGAPGAVIWSSVIERPVSAATAAPRQVAAQVSFTVRCILYAAADYPGAWATVWRRSSVMWLTASPLSEEATSAQNRA